MGRRFQLGPATFRVYAGGRNTVYRVSGLFDWFLKLPRKSDPAPIVRERLGAETVARALGRLPEYCGATVIRVSQSPSYVLASAIPGEPLNRAVFRRSWIPGEAAIGRLEQCFSNLGMLLARLHGDRAIPPEFPDATTRPFETLRAMVERIKNPDAMVQSIGAWVDARAGLDAGTEFVHGNFRLNNILTVGTCAGFIDLENCGRGSCYQDVSRPVSELLLARCLWAFPRRRTGRLLSMFLVSYARHHAYESQQLLDFVGARIARYFLETRSRHVFPGTVGGLPLRRASLDALTDAVLTGRLSGLIPELDVRA